WFDRLSDYGMPADPEGRALLEAVIADDRQLFDRSTDWPAHHRRAVCVGKERVILDGETRPQMVKMIVICLRHPGLTLRDVSEHWEHVHGPLAARAPGLRRYVQNHRLEESVGETRDGWAELWFDDLAALRAAVASPEWQEVRAQGEA